MRFILLGIAAYLLLSRSKPNRSNLGGFSPVYQTIHGVGADGLPQGNCFPACVASIMGMKLSDVPFFSTTNQIVQLADANKWLKQFGLKLVMKKYYGQSKKDVYCIARGHSPRFPKYFHMVVWKDGEIVHDPHPDQRGIVGSPTHLIYFEKL